MAAPDPSLIRFEEVVPAGANWSHVLKRGTTLRITDTEGGTNVSALFYNFELLCERLNLPDTLKCQHIARLTTGGCLYSDMGRILVSITEDTCGRHAPLGGACACESNMVRSAIDKRSLHACRDSFRRAEMDVITLISNCPQLNSPCNAYNPTPVRLLIWE